MKYVTNVAASFCFCSFTLLVMYFCLFKDFTAPQTVDTIKTEENVILNGTLNNVDVVNHFGITQFRDQPVTFKNATFGM